MGDITATISQTVISATVTNAADVTATASTAPITATLSSGDVNATVSETEVAATLLNGGTITATVSSSPITAVVSDGITEAQGDARYFQITNNLSEGTAATMRSNLGLGTLAVFDDAPSDGSTYGRKDGAWTVAAGVTDHSALSNLDYASAGHTGFAGLGVENVFTAAQTIQPTIDALSALAINDTDGNLVGVFDTINNRLGIGTPPDSSLHVLGTNTSAGGIIIESSVGFQAKRLAIFARGNSSVTFRKLQSGTFYLFENSSGTAELSINNNGYVTVGSATILARFSVKGSTDIVQNIIQANATQTAALAQHNISTTVHNEFFVPHASNLYTTVFNKQGSPLLDFKVLSDNYDALFVDASNDSIDVMHNTGGKVGFYATAPTVQQVLATGAGATVDNVITALQALGLVKQA